MERCPLPIEPFRPAGLAGAQEACRPGRPIRVGIADDHPIVRRSLRACLAEADGIEVVAEAATGRQAMEMARTHSLDVLLLDVDMPECSGLDVLPLIKARARRVRVLMVSELPAQRHAVALLRDGASGFLTKASDAAEVEQAIRRVAAGRRWIPPPLAQQIADETLVPAARAAHQRLSRRELQIFVKLARGRSVSQVANELSLSPKTVGSHRTQVMRKLGASTSCDLTYYALKHRLVD